MDYLANWAFLYENVYASRRATKLLDDYNDRSIVFVLPRSLDRLGVFEPVDGEEEIMRRELVTRLDHILANLDLDAESLFCGMAHYGFLDGKEITYDEIIRRVQSIRSDEKPLNLSQVGLRVEKFRRAFHVPVIKQALREVITGKRPSRDFIDKIRSDYSAKLI